MLKGIITALLGIWIFGAVIAGFSYEIDRKSECVRKEGLIKGILWCETDSHTQVGQASNIMGNMIRGLAWPVRLLADDSQASVSREAPSQTAFTKEQFENSQAAMLYTCYTIAMELESPDQGVLAQGIKFIRSQADEINRNHIYYLGYAAEYTKEFKEAGKGKIQMFYVLNCVKPVEKLRNLTNDGMLK